MQLRTLGIVLLVPAALSTASCRKDETAMTTSEAQQALQEAAISGEAENVTSGSIDIATDFTLGQAVETAAQEIRDFVAAQLPCAAITLTGPKLSIEYGKNAGNCMYRGHNYSGMHEITVTKNDMADVVVDHTWTKLSNGVVEVSGTAEVTWSATDQTRHVVHELDWKRLSDGKTGTGSGDRLQKPLEAGIAEGFQVDGSRSWTGQGGTWDLAIEGVQWRWADPVPQAGKYRLASPSDRSMTMGFERVDVDTIKVTVSSGAKTFSFNISKAGQVEGA
jgi:hypothetical protein